MTAAKQIYNFISYLSNFPLTTLQFSCARPAEAFKFFADPEGTIMAAARAINKEAQSHKYEPKMIGSYPEGFSQYMREVELFNKVDRTPEEEKSLRRMMESDRKFVREVAIWKHPNPFVRMDMS